MARGPRKRSEADIYHIFARGVGRQCIFEDDADRAFFLRALGKCLGQSEGSLLAWVLMENHFHLLLRMRIDVVSELMKRLQVAYANYFNNRYDRVGHLFQGRFGSQPICGDEQLMAVVRYIHRNPVEAGMCDDCDFKWSSYRGYLRGAAVTDTAFVMGLFGDSERFVTFHENWDDGRFSFVDATSAGRVSEAEARAKVHDPVARFLPLVPQKSSA